MKASSPSPVKPIPTSAAGTICLPPSSCSWSAPLEHGDCHRQWSAPSAGLISHHRRDSRRDLRLAAASHRTGCRAGRDFCDLIQRHGLAQFKAALVLAGLLQFLAGCASDVVHGGFAGGDSGNARGDWRVIFAAQLHVMLDAVRRPKRRQPAGGPRALWTTLNPTDTSVHHWAALVGVTTLFILFA